MRARATSRQAATAGLGVGRLERQTAGLAAALPAPVDVGPAIAAKAVQLGDDRATPGAARRKREIERVAASGAKDAPHKRHPPLLLGEGLRTSARVTRHAIDPKRQSAKRERARRRGGDLFLYRRAFAECAERLGLLETSAKRLLIVAAAGLEWTTRAADLAANVRALDALEPNEAELIIAVGVLEQTDDPALAAFILNHALVPGGRLLGATLGGRSLERLRGAMLDAERVEGRAVQRFHPMIDAPSLGELLSGAGFGEIVIDSDRIRVGYRSLDVLVADLRDMGCTASISGTFRPISRRVYERARLNFLDGQKRAEESLEILYFSAVAPNAL